MNCSRKSWTEYIISHAECTSTSNPTRQGNPFRGAVGDLDRSNCSAQSSTGRNASIPPNLPFYLMDYLVINVQLVIAICGFFVLHFSHFFRAGRRAAFSEFHGPGFAPGNRNHRLCGQASANREPLDLKKTIDARDV